ncbi:MAG TPA: methylated-DNA--[protein]-cysteine S-methyltransferase [Dehalococcoidia bacterium]|nr:methylated-DNA--[protein]-cysteine S-methyltransferase [Dehalococcoidia bacterium]
MSKRALPPKSSAALGHPAPAAWTIVRTAFGPMLLAAARGRVVALKFHVPARDAQAAIERVRHETRGAFAFARDDAAVEPEARILREYLDGERRDLPLKFDISWTSGFRRDVLLEVARVPRGHVATYGEIARRAGSPRAFRAVGHAMATNPIPILIPCHRIVGSNGSLTGFGGGLDMKRRLLALEGAAML